MKPLLLLAVAVAAACAPITTIPYNPNPSRVANPQEEVRALILANTIQGCVTEPEFVSTTLVVKFVCTGEYGSAGNQVVRFDAVDSIALQQSGDWYGVLVHHKNGAEDFRWTSKSRTDMEKLADALSALSTGDAAAAPVAEAQPASSI